VVEAKNKNICESFMREVIESIIEKYGGDTSLNKIKEKFIPTLEGFFGKSVDEPTLKKLNPEINHTLDRFIEKYGGETPLKNLKKELSEELSEIYKKIRK
jgi:hypothetical protein